MDTPVTVVIIGAGNRGLRTYAPYAKRFPERMKIVAAAEPDAARRARIAQEYDLPPERTFRTAQELFAQPRMADMAFICTQDGDHVEHACLAMERGYDLLLEKPVSASVSACKYLLERAQTLGCSVTVCHVLRYAPFYQKAKELAASGALGRIIAIQASENVGYWHMAHSYVRGNWRRADETSPMILAKCCHDMDILIWLADSPCKMVSSMGDTAFFRSDNAPAGAPGHCLDGCPVKFRCPYDAEKIYLTDALTGLDVNGAGWMQNAVTPDPTREGVYQALKAGPYGRCVFRCDNNVVDHQSLCAEMENGISVSFLLSGFNQRNTRTLRIMGTLGDVYGNLDEETLVYTPFGKVPQVIRMDVQETISGHGGGDYRMLDEMFAARAQGTRTATDLRRSLDGHFMALAAEHSRLAGGQAVDVETFVAGFPAQNT